MSVDEKAGNNILQLDESAGRVGHLPRSVCFRGGAFAGNDNPRQPEAGLCEFEVVAGNAAYSKGERFYLTWPQAERAYFRGRRAS